jgi:tripartite-type tricarboxylate transporter receptor subunit TctC
MTFSTERGDEMRSKIRVRLLLALLLCAVASAYGQTYPAKTVRVIVGFAPGGGSDIVARVVAQKLTEIWGQTVVVENRAGASGIIGAELVSKAAPDGYTLLVSSQTSTAVAQTLYSKLPYDVLKDFAIVTVLGSAPTIVMVHPSLPPRTFREFVDLSRVRGFREGQPQNPDLRFGRHRLYRAPRGRAHESIAEYRHPARAL